MGALAACVLGGFVACAPPHFDFSGTPDAGVEDVEATRTAVLLACASDPDCADLPATRSCDPASGYCVECVSGPLGSQDSCGAGLYCSEQKRCLVGCADDSDCNRGLVCDLGGNLCVGCASDSDCAAGTRCDGGTCAPSCSSDENCPAGFQCCGRACANPLTDPANCGHCGASCASGDSCLNGACAANCPVGFGECDGDAANGCEIDLRTDRAHCGKCALNCAQDACVAGACTAIDCAPGLADCDGDESNGCEANLGSSESCTMCGTVCNSTHGTPSCTASGCSIACDAAQADCDGRTDTGCETNTAESALNCGACGQACDNAHGSTRCTQGECLPTCAVDFGDCDGEPANGCETALLSSLVSCGACGQACELDHAAALCDNGVCEISGCDSGFDDCNGDSSDGCEADLSSPETCGDCSSKCNANGGVAACNEGACGITCDAGREDCINGLSDGCETDVNVSVLHCGDCATQCPASASGTPSCVDGQCGVSTCSSPFADCNGDNGSSSGDGCETNTNNDALNCAGCGIECYYPNGTGKCVTQSCVLAGCDAGWADCGASLGCETRLGTSANCTDCGDACSNAHGTTSCTANGCKPMCASGYGDCNGNPNDGCETPLDTLLDCGACGVSCSKAHATASCASGSCEIASCAPASATATTRPRRARAARPA